MFKELTKTLAETYRLARPYGMKRLLAVLGVVLLQGVFQVVGVASILPFLALAADPAAAMESRFGSWVSDLLGVSEPRTMLVVAGVGSILAICTTNALSVVNEYVRARYAASFGHWLRVRLLEHYARLPYSFFIKTHTGILIKRVAGYVNQFAQSVVAPVLNAVAHACTAAMLFLALVVAEPLVALSAVVIFGGCYLVLFVYLSKVRDSTSTELADTNNRLVIAVQNFFHGIKPVMMHSKAADFIETYGVQSERQARLLARVPVLSCIPRHVVEPVAFGGVVAVVLVMTASGNDLGSLLPTLGFFAFAGYRTIPAIQQVYASLTKLSTSSFVVDELTADLGTKLLMPESLSSDSEVGRLEWESRIALDKVCFSYDGIDTPALDNVSVSTAKGKSLGIIGTTGSGKSTLVDLLLGLHIPTSGSLIVDDRVITPELITGWRKTIGYVPQDIYLIHGSIVENIAFGVPEDEVDQARVEDVCRVAQIYDFIAEDLPEKYQTLVGERGIRLSGGQRQRIGLARALYHDPDVIVLDEATSALDVATERAFMDAIFEISGNLTFVIIAHRLSTIQNCDQVVLLERGRVVDVGTFEELKARTSFVESA